MLVIYSSNKFFNLVTVPIDLELLLNVDCLWTIFIGAFFCFSLSLTGSYCKFCLFGNAFWFEVSPQSILNKLWIHLSIAFQFIDCLWSSTDDLIVINQMFAQQLRDLEAFFPFNSSQSNVFQLEQMDVDHSKFTYLFALDVVRHCFTLSVHLLKTILYLQRPRRWFWRSQLFYIINCDCAHTYGMPLFLLFVRTCAKMDINRECIPLFGTTCAYLVAHEWYGQSSSSRSFLLSHESPPSVSVYSHDRQNLQGNQSMAFLIFYKTCHLCFFSVFATCVDWSRIWRCNDWIASFADIIFYHIC